MPYSSGQYSAPANSWNPAVPGTTIESAAWNSTLSDMETALSTAVLKDGTQTITANLPFAGFKWTGVNTNSGASSRSEFVSSATYQDGAPLDAGDTGGTSTAYTATLTPAITAYADKQCFRVKFNATCGANPTINFNSVGAKKIYRNVAGTATQLIANDVYQNFVGILRYDTALDGAAGGFWLINNAGLAPNSVTAQFLAASALGFAMVNGTLTASVAANALTVAVKTYAGTDATATDPVYILFRNTTLGTGDYTVITVSASLSLTVSSGSTLGTVSGVANRIYITCSNDAGTPRLGVFNTYNPTGPTLIGIDEGLVYSSTAEGGAGAADSAQVLYTGTAVTSKPIRILGYVESTQATAGTWATSPSKVQILSNASQRTGDIVQSVVTKNSAVATTTVVIPIDDTIPQSGEGNPFMSRAITPTNAANVLEVSAQAIMAYSAGGANALITSLFQDAGANAVTATVQYAPSPGAPASVLLTHVQQAGTTSSTTFTLNGGSNAAGTVTFNGFSGGRIFGGVCGSFILIHEIFA